MKLANPLDGTNDIEQLDVHSLGCGFWRINTRSGPYSLVLLGGP